MLTFLRERCGGHGARGVMGKGQVGSGRYAAGLAANTAAYQGRLHKARELSRRAVASAERVEENKTAAVYEADAACGNPSLTIPPKPASGPGLRSGSREGRDAEYVSGAGPRPYRRPCRRAGRIEKLADCLCQLDLAHFDTFIWPPCGTKRSPMPLSAFGGPGRSKALRRVFCGALRAKRRLGLPKARNQNIGCGTLPSGSNT
jgi:hypothetical protein